MKKKKYIIIRDSNGNPQLRLGFVEFHRHLVDSYKTKVLGGGKWEADINNNLIKLFGSSDDYGAPNKEYIDKAIKNFDYQDLWTLIYYLYHIDIDTTKFKIIY